MPNAMTPTPNDPQPETHCDNCDPSFDCWQKPERCRKANHGFSRPQPETQTPRCDAAEKLCRDFPGEPYEAFIPADVARQLETELATERKARESIICADCQSPLSHDSDGYWCEPCQCKAAEEYSQLQQEKNDERKAEELRGKLNRALRTIDELNQAAIDEEFGG